MSPLNRSFLAAWKLKIFFSVAKNEHRMNNGNNHKQCESAREVVCAPIFGERRQANMGNGESAEISPNELDCKCNRNCRFIDTSCTIFKNIH